MRRMKRPGNPSTVIDVETVFVLRNGWEAFMGPADSNGIAFGLVDGFESELGYSSIEELKSNALSVGSPWESLPARNWEWIG